MQWKHMLDISPDHPDILVASSKTLWTMGKEKDALSQLERAINVRSKYRPARNTLIALRLYAKDHSVRDTKEAIRLAQLHPPSSPFEQHLTALAFAHDSQFETALIKAQHALRWAHKRSEQTLAITIKHAITTTKRIWCPVRTLP